MAAHAALTVQAASKLRKSKAWRWALLIPVLLLGSCMGLTVLLLGHQATTFNTSCLANDGNLAPVLATIRTLESGSPEGNYTAQAAGSSASGAYQMIDSTWGNYGGYPKARLAPAETQDAKAADLVTHYLQVSSGDVSMVPVLHYIGHLPTADEMDVVPAPSAGNTLTPRQYQTRWLAVYETRKAEYAAGMRWGHGPDVTPSPDPAVTTTTVAVWACSGGDATGAHYVSGGPLPIWDGPLTGNSPYTGAINDRYANGATLAHQLPCSGMSVGGYANGRLPYSMLRTTRSVTLLPAASIALDRMAQAAMDELGVDFFAGSGGYASIASQLDGRPLTAGRSCHGVGLAVDVGPLQPGGVCGNSADECWHSPVGRWMLQHAADFGFINPDWALDCRGHQGDNSGVCEPWHLEWVAYLL